MLEMELSCCHSGLHQNRGTSEVTKLEKQHTAKMNGILSKEVYSLQWRSQAIVDYCSPGIMENICR